MDKFGKPIIWVALIWAVVIFASAVVLKGTPYWARLLPILGGGAAVTIIILGGALRNFRKRRWSWHSWGWWCEEEAGGAERGVKSLKILLPNFVIIKPRKNGAPVAQRIERWTSNPIWGFDVTSLKWANYIIYQKLTLFLSLFLFGLFGYVMDTI